jgi:hypothetical protein
MGNSRDELIKRRFNSLLIAAFPPKLPPGLVPVSADVTA